MVRLSTDYTETSASDSAPQPTPYDNQWKNAFVQKTYAPSTFPSYKPPVAKPLPYVTYTPAKPTPPPPPPPPPVSIYHAPTPAWKIEQNNQPTVGLQGKPANPTPFDQVWNDAPKMGIPMGKWNAIYGNASDNIKPTPYDTRFTTIPSPQKPANNITWTTGSVPQATADYLTNAIKKLFSPENK